MTNLLESFSFVVPNPGWILTAVNGRASPYTQQPIHGAVYGLRISQLTDRKRTPWIRCWVYGANTEKYDRLWRANGHKRTVFHRIRWP